MYTSTIYIYIYILFSYIHINLEKILKEKRDSTMSSSIKLRLAILQLQCWSTSLFFFSLICQSFFLELKKNCVARRCVVVRTLLSSFILSKSDHAFSFLFWLSHLISSISFLKIYKSLHLLYIQNIF